MQETLDIVTKKVICNTLPSKEWTEHFFQSLRSVYPFLKLSNSLKYRDIHFFKPSTN